MRYHLLLLLSLTVFTTGYADGQGSWEAVFRALIDEKTGSTLIESGRQYQGRLYNADVTFIITDGDGNSNNFQNGDSIDLEIKRTGLRYSGNKAGLTAFAQANGQKIFDAIFGADAAGSVSGASAPQTLQMQALSGLTLRWDKSAREQRQASTASQEASKQSQQPSGTSQKDDGEKVAQASNVEFLHCAHTRVEISFIESGPNHDDVFSVSGIPSYSISFGEYLQHTAGVLVPIRYAQTDHLDSEYLTFNLSPFIRYRAFEADSFFVAEDNFLVNVGTYVILNSLFLSSTVFGGGGYLRYGGCIFADAQWTPMEYLSVHFALSYQISKTALPSSFRNNVVSKDFRWLADVIDELPVDHELAFGLRFRTPLTDTLSVSLDYLRSHSLGSRAKSTTAFHSQLALVFDYLLLEVAEISIGYRAGLEPVNYIEHTILLGGLITF